MKCRVFGSFVLLSLCGCASGTDVETLDKADLGALLFEDPNLSLQRTQSCSTCHESDSAFVDPRRDDAGQRSAGSLGDDQRSLGDRNAPTAAYASLVPPFSHGSRKRFNTDGDIATYEGYMGGLFWDGRAADLAEQASGPPLNPMEMGMPDEESVVVRLLENPIYERTFRDLYGQDVWDDDAKAYSAMAEALGEFQKEAAFSPFDSRYDRSLLPPTDDDRYTYDPASPAAFGKALFFSAEFSNCAACHQLNAQSSPQARRELFSGYEFHNLGVPENRELRSKNGFERDRGLAEHVDEDEQAGKFRTPTLRNVAVTGPYMHNGVFRELSTVVRFYEHARRRAKGEDDESKNPETNSPWAPPEIDVNVSRAELASGNKDLSEDGNAWALECFLMTLTDRRYEDLLPEKSLRRCGI